MYSMWNLRLNLKKVYTCVEVSLCGVWHGIDFNKFFGSWNKAFLSWRAVSITTSPFYSHILRGFTIDCCYVALNWGTQSHCIFTPVTVWYLLPHLSGLASLAKTRVGRQVGQSFSYEEKNIRLWLLVHKTCFVGAVESSLYTGWLQKHFLISSSYKIKTYWNILTKLVATVA